jgi:hypothetical protein
MVPGDRERATARACCTAPQHTDVDKRATTFGIATYEALRVFLRGTSRLHAPTAQVARSAGDRGAFSARVRGLFGQTDNLKILINYSGSAKHPAAPQRVAPTQRPASERPSGPASIAPRAPNRPAMLLQAPGKMCVTKLVLLALLAAAGGACSARARASRAPRGRRPVGGQMQGGAAHLRLSQYSQVVGGPCGCQVSSREPGAVPRQWCGHQGLRPRCHGRLPRRPLTQEAASHLPGTARLQPPRRRLHPLSLPSPPLYNWFQHRPISALPKTQP